MTIEEAKKLGFRNYDPAIKAVPAWNGNDELHMVGVMRLDPTIHFPTRAKLRAANKAKKMAAATARQKAREAARKAKDDKFPGFRFIGFSGTEAGHTDIYEVFRLDGTRMTVSDTELAKNDGTFFPSEEAARLARIAWRRENQMTPITEEQAKDLREGEEYFSGSVARACTWHGSETDWALVRGGPAYWSRKAAEAALAKGTPTEETPEQRDARIKALVDGYKAKAEAEPLEWCERKNRDPIISGDQWTENTKAASQDESIGCWSDGAKATDGWVSCETMKWTITTGEKGFRARYHNPLWLAKHGKTVESHETPIRETQAPLSSTDETQRTFSTGAVRDTDAGKPRIDLIAPESLIALGNVLSVGAKHYGERNWEKGIPLSQFLASMMRHYVAVQMGDHSEDHDAKMLWNAMAFVATAARIKAGKLPAELDDIGWTKEAK